MTIFSRISPDGTYLDERSSATKLEGGARVRVAPAPYWPTDKSYRGQVGVLRGFSRPHGYAVVRIDGAQADVLLHPESLEPEG